MTASGTAGHGAELAPYLDLARLGAVVVKSLHAEPMEGNPPLRVHETTAGMINSVGLQGPGVAAWLADDLPALLATGARVVASIWGRSVDEYRRAADLLAGAPAGVVAVEVNLSCPNTEAGRDLFAHSPAATRDVLEATGGCGRPRWAKLSPSVIAPARDRRRRPRGGRRGGHARQHRDGHGDRPRDADVPAGLGTEGRGPVGPGDPPHGGAGGVRRARRAARPADRRGRWRPGRRRCRRAAAGRGDAGCRSGRPRSPTRGRPAGYWTSWSGGRHARAWRASTT